MNKVLINISILLALAIGAQANAEIYRWVDEKGVTHYGDRPSADAEPVRIRHGKAVGPTDEEKAETAELAALREDQCEMAKERFEEYNSSARLVEKDDFGKERELSSEEKLAAIAKAQSDVKAYCSE